MFITTTKNSTAATYLLGRSVSAHSFEGSQAKMGQPHPCLTPAPFGCPGRPEDGSGGTCVVDMVTCEIGSRDTGRPEFGFH